MAPGNNWSQNEHDTLFWMAHGLHIGNWGVLFGCSNGRHDQMMRNAADRHQLTHPAMGLIPLPPQTILIKNISIEITRHGQVRESLHLFRASSMNWTHLHHFMQLSLKEKANECLSIEALIVFLYISDIPWYWTIVIPTHSNTITQHLYYVTRKRLQLPVLFLLPPPYCSFQHTATLPIYYQTSPTLSPLAICLL